MPAVGRSAPRVFGPADPTPGSALADERTPGPARSTGAVGLPEPPVLPDAPRSDEPSFEPPEMPGSNFGASNFGVTGVGTFALGAVGRPPSTLRPADPGLLTTPGDLGALGAAPRGVTALGAATPGLAEGAAMGFDFPGAFTRGELPAPIFGAGAARGELGGATWGDPGALRGLARGAT